MTHGPQHHIEHAEHAEHAAHDNFNKMVTISIAIVAAVLACVTMLSHRSHNEVLRLQGEALRLQGDALQQQTLASIQSTKAANKWAYYQTKNIFHLESKITVDLLNVLATNDSNPQEQKKIRNSYQKNVDKYDKKLPQIEEEGHEMEKKSDEFIKESQHKMKESQEIMEESHVEHERTNRFDYGELGLQFGVVLCSMAILTKSKSFWLGGLISSAIGALIALTGVLNLFMGGHH